jgi:hypothetical protein
VAIPSIDDLANITDNTYTKKQIIEAEMSILNSIQFNISVVTVYDYIERYLLASCSSNTTVSYLVYYLSEISLLEYQMLSYYPSEVAASCIVLSLHILGLSYWVFNFNNN